MVHVTFDPSSTHLIVQQGGEVYVGKLFQRGRGLQGAGLGDVFRNIWRYLKPLATSAAKAVGQEGAETGARILSNLAQGANLKETLETQGKEGVAKILEKASKKIQRGTGLKRKKRAIHFKTPKVFLQPEDLIGKSVPRNKAIKKRPRHDTLGFY